MERRLASSTRTVLADVEPPARLLMTADTVGGVWTYAVELAAALEPFGTSVCLAAMGRPLSRSQIGDLDRLTNTEVYEGAFTLEWMENAEDDLRRAGDWLMEVAEVTQPDVVHLNGFAHGVLPWRAPTVVVGHSCVLSWWEAVQPAEPLAHMDGYRRMVRAGLQTADLVVAPTFAMLDALQRHYGTFRRARVIANGRDRKQFPVGVKVPVVFTAGRLWDPAKNVHALDRIAPRLAWPVCAAGEVAGMDGRKAELRHVTWLGDLSASQLSPWFAQSAIYALPAKYEPFGLSVLEAALAGCSLVLGDIPSLRELWDGVALFVREDEDLAEAIAWLIAHPQARQTMGIRARNRALRLSPRAMASGYLEAYREVREREPALVH